MSAGEKPEAWAEEETAIAAVCNCTQAAAPPGRRYVITSIQATLINLAAVAAAKAIRVKISIKGSVKFSIFLQQQKTAEAGGLDRFACPVMIPCGLGEAVTLTAEAGGAEVQVTLSMSGYVE